MVTDLVHKLINDFEKSVPLKKLASAKAAYVEKRNWTNERISAGDAPKVMFEELTALKFDLEALEKVASDERYGLVDDYLRAGGKAESLLEALSGDGAPNPYLVNAYFYISGKESDEAALYAWGYLQNRIMHTPSSFAASSFHPSSLDETERYLLYAARKHLFTKSRKNAFHVHLQRVEDSLSSVAKSVWHDDSYRAYCIQLVNSEHDGNLLYWLWLRNFFMSHSTAAPVASSDKFSSGTLINVLACSGAELKAAIIHNYSIMKLKMNDHSIRRQLAHAIFQMLQIDRNYGMEMWAECITFSDKYISSSTMEALTPSKVISDEEYASMLANESWLTDGLLAEFLKNTNYNYERLSILFSAKDNVTNIIKKAVFGKQFIITNGIRGIHYFLQYAICGLIKQNDVLLANELIELAFGNPNIEPRGLGVLLSGAIPSVYSPDDIISDTAYQMLMHWIEKLNEEDAAILKVKIMDHLTIEGD